MKLVAALALSLAVFVAACSGSTPNPPAAANASPSARLANIPHNREQPAPQLSVFETSAKGDLDEVIGRSYLRVLVAPNRTNFRTRDGMQRGRAVDIGQALQAFISDRAGKPINVILIETREDNLIPDLLAGKGDVAANILLTFERDDQVAFAKPWLTGVREIVVTGPKEPPIVSLEDVGGRSIHVRKTSDHFASLERLNAQLKGISRPSARIVTAAQNLTDEDLLEMVNAGKIPATLVDDYVYDDCCRDMAGLKANRDVSVSQDGSFSWVTRKDAPKLLALVNEFFSTHQWLPGAP